MKTTEVDEAVLALAVLAPEEYRTRHFKPLSDAEILAFDQNLDKAAKSLPGKSYRYYDVDVRHRRMKTNEEPERPMNSAFKFPYAVPVVRVALPHANAAVGSYQTLLGEVRLQPSLAEQHMHHGEALLPSGYCPQPSDHWYGTVEQLAKDWQVEGVTRVDLVTTARAGKVDPARFAAIGFYLVYQNDPVTPAFYVIEAGEALDHARQVYMSDSLASGKGFAQGWATYNPSRLSNPKNWYKAWLTGAIGPKGEWEPSNLHIEAFHTAAGGYTSVGDVAKEPYVRVTADFKESQPHHAGLGRTSIMCIAGGRAHAIANLWGFEVLSRTEQNGLRAARRVFKHLCAAESFKFEPFDGPSPHDTPSGHKAIGRRDSPCQAH